jgi:hypothetical protein
VTFNHLFTHDGSSIKNRRRDRRKQRHRFRHRYPTYPAHHRRLLTLTVRNLALQYPSSPLRSGPFLIYLTARSAEQGAEAVKKLNNDPALKAAKVLVQDGGDTTIKFQTLDISDVGSIHAFRDFLKKEHPEGIDVVVNNAGIAMDGFSTFPLEWVVEIC